MFFVYTPKREAVVFKFLRVDERSRKAAFSWRISVDGRPICRNKVAFSDSSHGEWKGTKFQLESYPIYRYCKAQKLSRQMINDSFICPFLNLHSKCSLRHKLSWLWSLLCPQRCYIPAGCKTFPSFSELIGVEVSSDFICVTDVVYH